MNIRKITSMTMLLSFILCILTSVILYIVPQGRVAYWADWHLWGMTKTQWGDLHINLGFLFLFAGFFHLFYNWKVITAYMKNRARQLKVFTPSFNVALVLCVVVGFGTFFKIPPVYSIISFSESIKDAAAEKYGEPPYGHAELSSLKSFCKKLDIDLDKAKELLDKAGIVFIGDSQSIADIAAANSMTPKEVHAVMKAAERKEVAGASFPAEPFPGFGRKVLADICNEYSLNIPNTLSGLAKENIKAEPNQTIKEIAETADMDPHAFFEILHRVVTEQNVAAGKPFPEGPFPGFGRKKLSEICDEFTLDTASIIAGLGRENIKAEAGQTIKEIAKSADMDPHAFFEILHRVVTE